MYLRDAWYVAAWADEIGQAPLARRILDEPIVLFRSIEGTIAALADRCVGERIRKKKTRGTGRKRKKE